MSGRSYSGARTGEYSVSYANMRGVDLSGDGSGISPTRLAYCENMYRDYEGDGAGIIESIPGYRRVIDLGDTVWGIYSYRGGGGERMIAVHSGTTLYDFPMSNFDTAPIVRRTEGISAARSSAFSYKDALYVLDGKSIFKLSDSFSGKVSESGGGIYIPTAYLNGEPYEQANLLSELVYEKTVIGSIDSVSYGTPGLIYSITDTERKLCSVIGISEPESDGKVYVPSRTKIGNEIYEVKEIGARAFYQNKLITECYISEGVTRLGDFAFAYLSNVRRIITPNSLTSIGVGCMTECTSLTHLHLGRALSQIGGSAVSLCPALTTIHYAGSTLDYMKIPSSSELEGKTIVYNAEYGAVTIGIDIMSPCKSALDVSLNGSPADFELLYDGALCKRIKLTLAKAADAEGATLIFKGRLSDDAADHRSRSGFASSSFFKEGASRSSVITGCRIAECFDGRIFLTDNPDYPGFCFYTSFNLDGETDPLYFGDMNYFKDGTGDYRNISLLASGDSLLVFKEGDDGGGSIFYHTPHETGIDIIPKIYPTSGIHSGFLAKGESISFFDDPVFISEKGLSAITKKSTNLERSIATRSENVNPLLLRESLRDIRLAVWRGNLVLAVGNRIYLGDSRSVFRDAIGNLQYEWFYLSGIGSYYGDKSVYRYSSISEGGLQLHENADGVAEGEVLSIISGGKRVYYVEAHGVKYEVYKTEELAGGIISPISSILSVDGLLMFGTEAGVISVFNSDKRGIAPPSENISNEEFRELYGRRIHPYYYSFANHAPRYAIKTVKDNCGIPHMTKDTVKYSLTVKCRSIAGGGLICEVGTDGDGYREICAFPNRELFFGDLDFSSLTLITEENVTVPIHEKTKGWIEKQISLYSEEYGAPFGIYSISYRFKVKGRIKKNKK